VELCNVSARANQDAWTLARIAVHSNIAIGSRCVHPAEGAMAKAVSRLSGHKIGHSAEMMAKSTKGKDDVNIVAI
jgi:hypothetical protein